MYTTRKHLGKKIKCLKPKGSRIPILRFILRYSYFCSLQAICQKVLLIVNLAQV